jgi:polyadenylate-binding protein 2
MKPYRYRGRRFDPYLAYYPPRPPYAPPYYGYGYGRMPRFRRPIRYRPC